MIDLTNTLIKSYQPYPRKIGRYNTSDLYAIVNGYITPENFLQISQNNITSCFAMWQGTWKHKQIQELLEKMGYIAELKMEYKCEDLTLVGKVDAIIPNDHLLEIKTSAAVMNRAKSSALYQAKVYTNFFPAVVGYVVQPIILENKLLLKKLGKVEADREWFEKQLRLLMDFHEKLKNKYGMEKN